MGKARSMNRKKKHDDAMSKKKHDDAMRKSMERPWSDLNHDVLILVMMKVGVVEFLAFSRVCKSWRSLAVTNRSEFLVSKPPMSIFIPFIEDTGKACHLEDFEGRKFKIALPHFAGGRWCIGITNGYLILFDEETNECWLVNLITGHELYFSKVPSMVFCCPGFFKGILVFSPSMSEWVFVVFNKCYHTLWVCIAGKGEWTNHRFQIRDLLAFKGKIYTIDNVGICEMKIYPKPKLVLLEIKIFEKTTFLNPGFVSFRENLYVIDRHIKHPYNIHELDFGNMELVSRIKRGKKYASFHNNFNGSDTFILREAWAGIHSQYGRYAVDDNNGNGVLYDAHMWYFFDDCLNVNLIHE